MTLAENLEVLNLRAIAGEYDFQARHIDLGKLPVFLENQQKGNYTVDLDPGDYGADMASTSTRATTPTRRSRSGSATPTSAGRSRSASTATSSTRRSGWDRARPARVVPADSNTYSPGPEWRTKWSTLDVEAGERAAGQDRADQEGRRGVPPAHRRQGPAAHRDHDARRPVRPVHPDRRDDPRAVEEDRHRPARCRRSSGAWPSSGRPPTSSSSAPGTTTAPSTCSPSRSTSSPSSIAAVASSGPLYGKLVPLRRHPGQGAAAADERADGEVEEGVRRARDGAHPARQGGLEDRRRGGLHHRRDRHGTGVHGRARGQEQHGEHPVASVQ